MQQSIGSRHLRRDDEDPIHAMAPQPLDGVGYRGPIQSPEAGHDDEVARLVGGALDSEQRRGRTVESGIEADDSECVRASSHQRPGYRVRPVAEFEHRLQDPLARLRADVRAAVDDPGNGLMRDARQAGHVGHHRAPFGCEGYIRRRGYASRCPR